MHLLLFRLSLTLAILLGAARGAKAEPDPAYGKIELIRDRWGIPHVFAATDAGAVYGLGYATAEERGFQMTYGLRLIQGRLAEVLGERQHTGRRETTIDHDRRMRLLGWTIAAARMAERLDPQTKELLIAYSAGVNDSFAAQKASGRLHPLFAQLDVSPEQWTPADCLLSWWHLAQFFASDGTRDLLAWRNRAMPRPGQPQPPKRSPLWFDDAASVVRRDDVSEEWVHQVEAFCSAHGLRSSEPKSDSPKFSHAWVVGGKVSTTGSAVLVSDPQTPVRNPSLWMEFHIAGRTFNVRGIGVPGSPGVLIGYNRQVAWGLTALGADQADLFRLETDPQHPDQYRWDGTWRPMRIRTEKILVKNGPTVELNVKETHLGPVMSAFVFRQPNDPEVALKRIPLCETNGDTIEGAFAMMRARDAREFAAGLARWRTPTANCLFGDAQGQIGYATIGAIPIRPASAEEPAGNEALAGRGEADDWQGYVPQELLPHLANPTAGYILSANHRPIASFYPIPLGLSTGSMGDTLRSWRLRELLSSRSRFTPTEVLAIHEDAVNPARREMVRVGIHLRDTRRERLSEDALKAINALEPWWQAGASSDLTAKGAELATQLSTFFRFVATPLALKYGGGESGLARFLKSIGSRLAQNPNAPLDEEELTYVDGLFAEVWRGKEEARESAGRAGRREVAHTNPLGYLDSLDGFGSLERRFDVVPRNITCLDGQTLRSEAAQSYTQWVSLHDVDAARSVCPIGHSDRPDSPLRTSTLDLWQEGELHPAPLSRDAVERLAGQRMTLSAGRN